MPINVTIQSKLSQGVFHALGTVEATNPRTKQKVSGEADLLVREVDGNVELYLDSSIHSSKIAGSEVLHFIMQDEIPSPAQGMKKGTKLIFTNVNYNIKK